MLRRGPPRVGWGDLFMTMVVMTVIVDPCGNLSDPHRESYNSNRLLHRRLQRRRLQSLLPPAQQFQISQLQALPRAPHLLQARRRL